MSFKRKSAIMNAAKEEVSKKDFLEELKSLGRVKPDEIIIEKLSSLGLNKMAVAGFFGMSDRNLRLLFKAHPEYEEAFLRGQSLVFGRIMVEGVNLALNGDKDMIKFFLKTRADHSEVSRIEHTGKDGEDIKVVKSSESEVNVINKLGHQFSSLLIEDGKVIDED